MTDQLAQYNKVRFSLRDIIMSKLFRNSHAVTIVLDILHDLFVHKHTHIDIGNNIILYSVVMNVRDYYATINAFAKRST